MGSINQYKFEPITANVQWLIFEASTSPRRDGGKFVMRCHPRTGRHSCIHCCRVTVIASVYTLFWTKNKGETPRRRGGWQFNPVTRSYGADEGNSTTRLCMLVCAIFVIHIFAFFFFIATIIKKAKTARGQVRSIMLDNEYAHSLYYSSWTVTRRRRDVGTIRYRITWRRVGAVGMQRATRFAVFARRF